jgi:hypothetical protein
MGRAGIPARIETDEPLRRVGNPYHETGVAVIMANDIKPNDRQEKSSASTPSIPSSSAPGTTPIEGVWPRLGDNPEGQPGRPAQISATNSSAEGQQIDALTEFKINCLASALYHEDRERFFSWVHRTAMFLVVASGTAALSPMKETFPHAIPAITTLVGLLDLVFDLSGKARLHAGLRKQVFSVLADADGHDNICSLNRRLTLIYAEEPPTMYAVNAVAYNRAMMSYGRSHKFLLDISDRDRIIRHIWPFTANTFKSFDELEAAKLSGAH